MVGGSVVLSTESDVITIDGYTITADKAGTAIVTVTATTAAGTVQTTTFTVTVAKTPVAVANENEIIVDFNSATPATIDLAGFDITGEVVANANYTVADGVLTFATTATRGEYQTIVVETATHTYSIPNITVVDIEIKDEATVDKFFMETSRSATFAIVTADVDMADHGILNVENTAFAAQELSGRGHTIANMTVKYSLFGGACTGYIHDIAFVGLVKTDNNVVGILGNNFKNGQLENVYLEVSTTTTSMAKGSFFHYADYSTFKNIVAIATVPSYMATHPAWSGQDGVQYYGAFDNLYVITNHNNGYIRGDNENCTNPGGAYATNAAFLEAVDEAALVEKLGSYWKLVNGMPVFASAEKYLVAQATMDGADKIKQNDGATYTVSGATVTKWEVAGDALEGIKIENGVVTVAKTVEVGTVFTVKAYASNVAIGEYVVASKNVTVEKADEILEIEAIANKNLYLAAAEGYETTIEVAPVVTLDGEAMTEGVVVTMDGDAVTKEGDVYTAVSVGSVTVTVTATTAKGTVKTVSFTITVAKTPVAVANENEIIMETSDATTYFSKAIAEMGVADDVVAVKLNGTALAAEAYTLTDGTLALTDKATLGEYMTLSVETATRSYNMPNVTVVTMNIQNKEDLVTARAANVKNTYYIVTASFDATGVKLANWLENSTFSGRGNTINGAYMGSGAIWGIEYGGMKNIAFTNIDVQAANLIYHVRASVMENCFIHVSDMYHVNSAPTYLLKTDTNGKIVNTVFAVENGTRWPGTWKPVPVATTGIYENVHVAYPQMTEATYDGITKYASVAELNAQATTLAANLGSMWTVHNGTLMFATATQFFPVAE